MNLQEAWQAFLDIIYPTDIRCFICCVKREDMLSYGICELCESNLPFIEPPVCTKCGKMMLIEDTLCLDCQDTSYAFYKGISIFEFSTEVKRLIHRYKYKREKYLSTPMIHWMTEGLKLYRWDFDLIVPVPLHPNRQRQRGFNQAELLARGLSKNTGVPLVSHGLLRIRNTPQQARLDKEQRQKNLEGAFEISQRHKSLKTFHNKTILLVDDVYTTGSTAHQCAKVLLAGGADRVYVITLAMGSNL